MAEDRPILSTERLTLRPRRPADLEACLEMDMDPAVSRYIWPNGAPDRAAHRATLLDRMLGDWPEIGGYWVAEWRDRPGFLGWCGLFPLEDSGLVEIGYRYCQRAWGQGVGSEAAAAVLDHGFRQLALDPIVAVTNPGNRASRRVLAKIGLEAAGTAFHYGQDLSFFRLGRDRYLRRVSG